MDKEKELKRVLADERSRSVEWKSKYQTLKEAHLNLSEEYLSSQGELKKILVHTKQIKETKDDEINELNNQLEEKIKQIDYYLIKLKEKEEYEETFKRECKQELNEHLLKFRKEFDQLKIDKLKLNSENDKLKQKINYLEQENEIKLRNLVLEHQNEFNNLEKEKNELKIQFKDSKKHPDYEKLIKLGSQLLIVYYFYLFFKLENENQELKLQINNLHLLVNDADDKYKKIDDERERLIVEQNMKLKNLETRSLNAEQENHKLNDEQKILKNKLTNYENQLTNLKIELDDLKMSKDLLIQQHANELKRKQNEKDELNSYLNEEKIKYELEIEKIKQEKRKFKNDYEDAKERLDKLENLIDQKEKDSTKDLSKAIQIEKDKYHNLVKEKQNLIIEKEETEDNLRKVKDDLNLKQKQYEELVACKFELEKEIKQLKSQISTLKLAELEMDKLKKESNSLYEDFKQLRIENSELSVLTKQLSRENSNIKEQFNLFRNDVEEEKKQFHEYKQNSERNLNKLRNSFDLEKSAMREEIEELKDELRAEKRKRTDIKTKCVQYCEIAKKLHKHLKQIELNEQSNDSKQFRPAIKDKFHVNQLNQNDKQFNLRKQYKQMKNTLAQIQNSEFCKLHQN